MTNLEDVGGGSEGKAARRRQRRAVIRSVAYESVESWAGCRSHLEIVQEMCRNLLQLEEGEVPSSITQCKKLFRLIFINIYDYVDGIYDKRFKTIVELRKRCKNLQRNRGYGFYPIKEAKSDGLKDLLRTMF